MAIHGLFDVGKASEILDCNEEAPLYRRGCDRFSTSRSILWSLTSTDEALREMAIALQEEQKPTVWLERKPRFKTLTEKFLQAIEDTRQTSATKKKKKCGVKIFEGIKKKK